MNLKQLVEPFTPDVPAQPDVPKAPLNREELRHVIQLALWSGQLLLQNGAETQQVEETVHRIGTGLGCAWMDVFVSPNAVIITAISGEEFRTKIRRVVSITVNLHIIEEIHRLYLRVVNGELDRFGVEAELLRINGLKHNYNRWLVVSAVGLACGAFSRLFGGDFAVFGVTTIAAACAMFVRQELLKRRFNVLLTVVITSLVASIVASSASLLRVSSQPSLALASAVLLSVPGVHLINAAEDLLKGHMITGIARGVLGGLITLCIALGLLLGIGLMGVSGL